MDRKFGLGFNYQDPHKEIMFYLNYLNKQTKTKGLL